MQGKIHYRIIPANPEAHLYEVQLTIKQPSAEGQQLSLPAWIPGSYMIRDFAKNIVTIKADCAGDNVQISKLDKQTWLCAQCDGVLTLTYTVYAWDLSVRSAHLDQTHAYFNGTSVFLAVSGQEDQACEVEILRPHGGNYQDWQVATSLKNTSAAMYDFGGYQADNYDELIDHPVEMGEFTLASFDVAGVLHDIAITGKHAADMDRLCADLKIICEHHVALFGELPEMDHYVFQVMVVGDGYGGLEHRASTSLLCSRDNLPRVNQKEVSEKYRAFLGLCSHEYFHTWNVKRIKPAVFIPYDLKKEQYTHLMWMFEGITSYYDDLSLVRTGLIAADSYLELLAQNITRLLRTSGHHKQTVWDSSFDTWTKFYQQDENAPNAIVSYYGKGALIALGLDLTIRKETHNKTSLDDVMRYLWSEYGKKGTGVPEQTIEDEISKHTSVDLSEFFDLMLRTTQDLPLQLWLEEAGIEFALYPAASSKDKGGKLPESSEAGSVLGVRLCANPLGAELTHVLDQGAAQNAGLSAGDIVIAIENLKVSAETIEEKVAVFNAGDSFKLHAFRRDELMEFQLQAVNAQPDSCALSLKDEIPDWLKGE